MTVMDDDEKKWMKERRSYCYALVFTSYVSGFLATREICRLMGWSRDWTWSDWAMTLIGSTLGVAITALVLRIRAKRSRRAQSQVNQSVRPS